MIAEDRKKLRIALGGLVVCAALLLSAKEDHFQELVNQQEDQELASKLESFRSEGIERKVDKENYEPEKAIEEAFSYVGTPHRMSGTSHKGIDCSGLIMKAHQSCAIALPHCAQDQARYGQIIPSVEDLQRGDLVFFYGTYATSKLITHTGIYLGEQEFIHASSSKGVVVSKMDNPYYSKRFIFGTRL